MTGGRGDGRGGEDRPDPLAPAPGAGSADPTRGGERRGARDRMSGSEMAPAAGSGSGADHGSEPRGADMARAALEAARARNAAARGARGRREASKGSGDVARRLRRRRWSGPGSDKARDPQLFGDIARRWIVQADVGGELVKARLIEGWESIVGAEIADHAQPVNLVDRELTVRAESTAWATQLRLLAPGIVKRINEALGHGTVVRIRTQGPTAPSWRFGNRHVPGRGPRDTYG